MKVFISENSMLPAKQSGFGISLEDVNFAFDGGLYAEMLENRNFEAKEVKADGDRVLVAAGGTYGWEPWPKGADVALKLKTDRPLFAEAPHYMRVVAGTDGAGMRNRAYGGMTIRKGVAYRLTFYVRSYDYKDAAFVGLWKDGDPVVEKRVKIKPNGKWTRYEVKLKSKVDVEGANFAFLLRKAGMVHANDFSLMPEDAILGVFRRDLLELLKEMKPKFLRFAGGHIPGSTLAPYAWKDSVSRPERRRQLFNPWAIKGQPHYGQTLGLGYFECFRLAEYLGAYPVPTVMLPDVPPTDPEFEACVQDLLDLVEFANGDKDTMWGSLRDELGHAAPFGVKWIAVEDGVPKETLSAFAARVHRMGDVRLVLPASEGDLVWQRLHVPAEELTKGMVLPQERTFLELSAASKEGENSPASGSWQGALAEAACLISLERNADMVPFKSFAPLLARIGFAQRVPALIWFDGSTSFCTPSYDVQKLFSLYTGDLIVQAETETESVLASASEQDGFTIVKLANLSGESVEAEVEGDFEFGSLTRVIRMEGELTAFNSVEEPEKLRARDVAPAAPRSALLPPHSFSVLIFRE